MSIFPTSVRDNLLLKTLSAAKKSALRKLSKKK